MLPFQLLLKSRKFWLVVLDALVSILLFIFTGSEVATQLILLLQPVFVTIIGAIAYEDVGRMKADAQK